MNRNALAAVALGLGLVAAGWPDPWIAPKAHARTSDQQTLAPDVVRDIQRNLNRRGYGVGPVDGVMGASTRSAIIRFQRDNGLPTQGIDRQTLAALGVAGMEDNTQLASPAPGQTLSPRMVQQVQRDLRSAGYDPGRLDGRWGEETRRALMEYQRDHNLAVSGRIDQQTLAALERGTGTQTGTLPDETGQRR